MSWRQVLSWEVTDVEEQKAEEIADELTSDFSERIISSIDNHFGPQMGEEWNPVPLFTFIKEKIVQRIQSIDFHDIFAQGT